MKVKIKKLRVNAVLPEYKTAGAACMDLHASIDQPITLQPGEYQAIPSGIAVEVPAGYELQIRARSGWAVKNGVGLVNGIGTIDSDYRGEISVILINWGKERFEIQNGDRIAQILISKIAIIEWNEAEELNISQRGDRKFGSTGR